MTINPSRSASKVKETNSSLLNNASMTVSLHLSLPSRRAARKTSLTPLHKENRVAFTNIICFLANWQKSLNTGQMKAYSQWRGQSKGADGYDPKFVVRMWGILKNLRYGAVFLITVLVIIEGVIPNGERELDLLFQNLEESFEKCRAETFMQDDAVPHATEVSHWRKGYKIVTQNICRTGLRSPDLSPKKMCWAVMKNTLWKDTSFI